MPKEVTDVKKFLSLAKGDEKPAKDQEGKKETTKKIVFIKESKKITKFKLRGKKYLYTFQTADKGKAQKLIASLPNNMTQNVNSKKVNLKKKGKK